jgi:hypothetical protein
LVKTLGELQRNPNSHIEFPELYAGLREILALFRFIPPKIILPQSIHDVLSAQQGDPVAAARLHNMVPETKKLPPELVTDAIIKVLRTLRGISPPM